MLVKFVGVPINYVQSLVELLGVDVSEPGGDVPELKGLYCSETGGLWLMQEDVNIYARIGWFHRIPKTVPIEMRPRRQPLFSCLNLD